ncbi:hypothetical protein DH2020_049555 [Rehmannia glutinosa]|uniref:N-acetyltransferase domain-containing protein n=1 Tax=Rehmannia glutinosa TaxID=99300 RepID=A0ABR0U2F4_REHGL
MAHLHYNHSIVVKGSRKNENYLKKIPLHNLSFTKQTIRLKKKKNNRGLVHCCSSSSTSTSSDQQVNLDSEKLQPNRAYENETHQFGYLVSDVDWQVRRMVETEEEMRKVAYVQAEAFHEPAEVLSGLLYRLRNSPPDRYACLVAEPRSDDQESNKELAGVVDVTVLREDSVLEHLPGAEEYLYVSGIAVLNKFRRQKVATTLLKACDILSAIWGFEYLALRAYEDDYGARKLYSNAGYRVVSGDSPWTTTWIGRRRRVLMVKRSNIQ